mgnify:CR=1 FL=1
MNKRYFCVLLLAGGLVRAQDPGLQGPTSGLLYDAPSQAIRLVIGIPGAAYLGPEVAGGISSAYVAPGGEAALAERDGAWYVVTALRGESPVWTPVEELQSSPRLAAWSADSRAVVFADDEARLIRVIKAGDAGGFAVSFDDLPGRVVALAAGPEGKSVYAATMEEERGGGIYRSGEQPGWTLMSPTAGAARLAFSPQGDALFAADPARGELLEFRYPEQAGAFAPAVITLPEPEIPFVALQLSRDGRKLLAARGGESPRVDVIDVASHELAEQVELDTAPAVFERLAGGPHLLLNARTQAGDVVMILADRPAAFRAFFVPVGE